jgi:Flp pilus assembly protein TadG
MNRMRRFLKSRRGSILIEAAIAFPVLIAILLAMVEFGQAFTVKRRNAQVASTVADLVAQVSCVTGADLQDTSKTAAIIMAPSAYSTTIAGLRITSVMQNAEGASVDWSYAIGTLGAATKGGAYALPPGLASEGQAVIVAEASYKFTPAIGKFLKNAVTFSAKAYNKPRLSASVVQQSSC